MLRRVDNILKDNIKNILNRYPVVSLIDVPEYMDYVNTVQNETSKTYEITLIKDGELTPAWNEFKKETIAPSISNGSGYIRMLIPSSMSYAGLLTKPYCDIVNIIEQNNADAYVFESIGASCLARSASTDNHIKLINAAKNTVNASRTLFFSISTTSFKEYSCHKCVWNCPQ